MTQSGNNPDAASNTQTVEADFVRVLSEWVRSISGDHKRMREMVYELARIKLAEQFTHADARELREILEILEHAVREVEHSFERNDGSGLTDTTSASTAEDPPRDTPLPFPPGKLGAKSSIATSWRQPYQATIGRIFGPVRRTGFAIVLIAIAGGVVAYFIAVRTQVIVPSQRPPALSQKQTATGPHESQTSSPSAVPQAGEPEAPKIGATLPTTFGIYALSDGRLQELKPLTGKIPDRRVAISAAITTPNAVTVASGDVKFIVFRPDAVDASGSEVRVMAKVSRTMGVDGSGKASMANSTDSWVIRSMSFPYKVGPVDDQPRMFSLQPENEGFALPPGRYALVVKGAGYDFTVAGDVTDPNQCVERINATNGAFYSPCPQRR